MEILGGDPVLAHPLYYFFSFLYLPSELRSMLYDLFVYGLGEGGLWGGGRKILVIEIKIKQRWDFV